MSDTRTIMSTYLLDIVDKGDIDRLDDIAHPDVIDQAAVASGYGPGVDGWKQHVRSFRSILPNAEIEIIELAAGDDVVIGIWRARGVHSAPLFGIAATGREIDMKNCSVFKLRDGKVIEYYGVWGALDAYRGMGASVVVSSD